MLSKFKKYCFRSLVATSSLFVCVLLLSKFLEPISSFIVCILGFLLVTWLNYRCLNKKVYNKLIAENDESKIRIVNLEHEIAKVNAIDKIQQEKDQIKDELVRTTSYNHHLAGLISGLNHELSPWISGIHILAARINSKENDPQLKEMLKKIEMATMQIDELLKNLSKSVNRVKNFSVFTSSIRDTVSSWIQIVILERNIKDKISKENIEVDLESLDFVAQHSPMYLSQVILNLTKNSIDHNQHMLDTLKIKIYGDKKLKRLIYEDNGKGIPPDILGKVFSNFGVTTKKCESDSGEIHGFGLYSCLNYCLSMNAIIEVESSLNQCTRFIIKFEKINDNHEIAYSDTSSGVYHTRK